MPLLGCLQNKESLTVVVVGKGGVGKSSTVNSIIGERVTVVSAFQVTGGDLDESLEGYSRDG
jgi:predicted GTPase